MDRLNLDLWTFDVSAHAETPEDYARLITERITASWQAGADIVMFPEFSWMGLERFVTGEHKLAGVAELFWQRLWPDISRILTVPGKAAVLGTVPFLDATGAVRNRVPILNCGNILYQDKIHLTPWESDFSGGGPLVLWSFNGLRVAVVICLDIEIPEISAALRGLELNLLLVPSATETLLGVERVGRCADARAVELGCYVGLCHLVGKSDSTLVDEQLGKLAVFAPSQVAFLTESRQRLSDVFEDGFHRLSASLDITAIRRNRNTLGETDPSKVLVSPIQIEANNLAR